jgi:predicted neuraminidase
MMPIHIPRWPIAILMLASTVVGKPSFAQTGKTAKAKLIKSELILNNPPFPSSHASSITQLPNGNFLATWFGGTDEGNKDVCIWTAELKNNKWAPPVQVADGIIDTQTRYPCWNPVLITTKTGRIILFYKVGPNPIDWWGEMKSSTDNGRTWSKAEKLPDGILGPIKNKPIQLANGDLLHPSSIETHDKKWLIHVEHSDSTGHHWTKTNINCDTFKVIQPSILSYGGSKLQMVNRSAQNAIVETWSDDNGKTWSPLTKLNLKNPNSGIDGVTMKNGLQAMVYNPTLKTNRWSDARYDLRVAVSRDGKNWTDVYTLENQPKGEFSYPAIIEGKDGNLHITYTYNRVNVKYVVLGIPKGI